LNQSPKRGNETSWVLAGDLSGKSSNRSLQGGNEATFQKVFEAKREFGDPHPKRFAIHTSQSISAVGAEAFGDIGFVPSEAVQPTGQGDGVFVMRGCDQATRSEMDIC
jgi:hypothetical protein